MSPGQHGEIELAIADQFHLSLEIVIGRPQIETLEVGILQHCRIR
jgi:hypothetical protein